MTDSNPPNLRALVLDDIEDAARHFDQALFEARQMNDAKLEAIFLELVLGCRCLSDAVTMLLDDRIPK